MPSHRNRNHIMRDIGRAFKPVGHEITHVVNSVVDLPKDVIHTTGRTVTSLGSSLSLPLLVVGAGVVVYLVTKK